MKSLIYPLRKIGLLTIALTVALAANFAYGQWANPTETPPGGNVAVPIHTAASTQVKTGNFGAVDILAAGVSEAGDHMRSPVYCDANGFGGDDTPFTADDDCFEADDVGFGGGSVSGSALEQISMMYQAYGVAAPSNMYAWPDWYVCGARTYDISGSRAYKDISQVSGVSRHSFDAFGAGSCGGIRDICLNEACGMYGTDASGADFVTNPAEICNAFGCSAFGACSSAGCPTAPGMVCDPYGCS